MIRSAALIGVALTLLAFCLGWCVKPTPDALTPPVVAMRQNAPAVTKPGWAVKGAAVYFAKLNAPPPPPPAPKPPPPPPPPDVSTVFRAQMAAVVETPEGLRLLVANRQTGVRQTRMLNRGDVFQDGWTVAAFDHRHVELHKGAERRLVPFFGPLPPPPVVPIRGPGAPAIKGAPRAAMPVAAQPMPIAMPAARTRGAAQNH